MTKRTIIYIVLIVLIPLLILIPKLKKETDTDEYGSMQETYIEEEPEVVEKTDNKIYGREVLDETNMPYGPIYRLENDFNNYLIDNGVYGESFEIDEIVSFRGGIEFDLSSINHKYHAIYKLKEDIFIFSEK